MSRFSMLPALIVDNCSGCPYRSEGPAIGSRGDIRSPLVLVGEAPGKTEIERGRPFVGLAGDRLRDALREAGLREDHAFITNSVACRPRPRVRPKRSAIRACRGRLIDELARTRRMVIVALGGTALQSLMDDYNLQITRERGKSFDTEWGPVFPTLHPAYVRRVPSEYQHLVQDLRQAGSWLEGPTR